MIPLRLCLRNFMCYRQAQTLDLQGIHLACLAGDNGHGKSALLDAITWALWGKARSHSDDELVAHGTTDMGVDFEFLLGDACYRVIRKRSLGRTSKGALEFQIRDSDGFRPLTAATQRDTQARITDTLHLDYDTFINSALLLQGRADEFTVKAPGERKRILADILGLAAYDEYEQRAKDKAREREISQREAAARIQEIERELVRRPEYVAELDAASAELGRLSAETREADAALLTLRDRSRALQAQQEQALEVNRRIAEAEKQLANLTAQLDKLGSRIAACQGIVDRRDEITSAHARLLQAREREAALGARLAQLLELNEERNELEKRVAQARQALEMEIRILTDRLRELDSQAGESTALTAEQHKTRSELDALAERQSQAEQHRETLRGLASEAATLAARNAQLKADMAAAKDKLVLLQQPGADCPLCGQDLAEAERTRLLNDLSQSGAEQASSYRANSARMKEIDQQTRAAETELAEIERDLRRLPALQGRLATLIQALQDASTAANRRAEQQPQLAALELQLKQRSYATAEQEQLEALSSRIAALAYDKAEHEKLRLLVSTLSKADEAKSELERSEQMLAQLLENRAQLLQTREQLSASTLADRERQAELASALESAQAIEQQLENQVQVANQLHAREGRARQSVGAAQQKLDTCRYLETQHQERTAELARLVEERALFEELQLAFGKKGLQALIIETAIPELEEEANRLLGRMTDGRMNLRFDTQRDTRSHSTVETLDIKVADETGTRSYEMFSGGEAFRINLAVRIALSKLLARRSGAQLQTLIVDEGFGTQDADGRIKLVEAINSIRDDFALILVITHIDELKDAFPVRIDVVKTATGSQISMV